MFYSLTNQMVNRHDTIRGIDNTDRNRKKVKHGFPFGIRSPTQVNVPTLHSVG